MRVDWRGLLHRPVAADEFACVRICGDHIADITVRMWALHLSLERPALGLANRGRSAQTGNRRLDDRNSLRVAR